MSRYIDVDALKEYIGGVRAEFNFFDDDERARYEAHSKAIYLLDLYVSDAPSIDIEPKRGEWIEFDTKWGRSLYYCTNCMETSEVPTAFGKPLYDFCPNCGADMRGKDNEF